MSEFREINAMRPGDHEIWQCLPDLLPSRSPLLAVAARLDREMGI